MRYVIEILKAIHSGTRVIKAVNFNPVYRFTMNGNNYEKQNEDGGKWETIPKIVVHGEEYLNVLKLSNSQNNIEIYKEAFYVRNVGLVKYTKKDGSVWEFIRYKVNQ